MRALRILGRNIRDSFHGVFRNFSLSLASISCITITLIVVSISIILTYNVNNFAKLVEKDVTIVAFLEKEVTEEQILIIEEQINDLDFIANYTFHSKEDIREDMMNSSEDFKEVLENLGDEENPLQDTYQIKVTEIEQLEATAKKIEAMEGVKSVKYGEGMVEQLITVFSVVQEVSVGIVIALVVVTAFLITNTIKITILSRRREIQIMRLVGASNLNIKIPFIFEGLFLGIMGSVIPVIITIYGYTALYNHFNGQMFSPFIKLVEPAPFVYMASLVLIVIGITVGMFGSWNAVKKYLKI